MAVRQHKDCLGRFILATNQCDRRVLSNEAVLSQYKQQSTVETGFKFIKDNAFELDSFYLKTPERIGALMAVMTFCLLVYNFLSIILENISMRMTMHYLTSLESR